MSKIMNILFIVIYNLGILASCTNDRNSHDRIPSIISDTVTILCQNDSILYGEYYQALIYIPEFDSLCEYSCLIGNNKVKDLTNGNGKLLQMVSHYDSIPLLKNKNFYYIVMKPEKEGAHFFSGFIREKCNNIDTYYPFKGSYYVSSIDREDKSYGDTVSQVPGF